MTLSIHALAAREKKGNLMYPVAKFLLLSDLFRH